MKLEEFTKFIKEQNEKVVPGVLQAIEDHNAFMRTLAPDPRVGDVWIAETRMPTLFDGLAIVKVHADDPSLFYMVPVDDYDSLTGSLDVIGEDYLGRCQVLRVGCGMWVHRDDLRCRFTVLADGLAEDAWWVLSEMVGKPRKDPFEPGRRGTGDEDPDYEDLIKDLRVWMFGLEQEIVFEDSEMVDKAIAELKRRIGW